MKRFLNAAALALMLTLAVGYPVLAAGFPSPQGYVSDFAGLLSNTGKTKLESDLSQLAQDTTAEVAVVTIASLDGDTIEEYAVNLFAEWGIGTKEEDNGVLFLIAVEEREVRIEVGYGLEAILTDGRCGRILDNDVLPSFRNGDYETGILQGAASIETYIRDGTPADPAEDNLIAESIGDYLPLLVWLGAITVYLMGFMARSKSIWLGAIWGIIAGWIIGIAWGSTISTVISPIIGGCLGALLDFVLSRNYKSRVASGKSVSWFASGGGFRGGGSSGGSFGGFSGGHSGGGGASRGW
jgi:uncharacterized protein